MVSVIYSIDSSILSGVERRFLNIVDSLCKDSRFQVGLIVNQSLYDVIVLDYNLKLIIDNVQDLLILVDVKSRYRKTIYRNFYLWSKRSILSKYNHCHLVLDFYSIFVFKLLKMNVHFEVSSPDVVDRCLKINKRIILPLFASLNCVSPSVLKRFQKEYSGNNLMSAPSTFYCIKEISMDVIMEKENIIVYGSRFLPRKNPVLFALVVNEILIKYNDWKVFVMGNGDLEDQVTNILRVHIAEGRAVVGRVVDLFELLKKSKIYVSIIEPDNYPSQSILEAMNAYNSLLISNNGDSYRFIDKSNLNGELVNLNFVEIFQGLERLISLPHDTQQRVCLNSYFYLKKSFSSSQYLDYLYKLYKHQ